MRKLEELSNNVPLGIVAGIENPADIEEKLRDLLKLKDKDFYNDLNTNIFQRQKQYSQFLNILM